LSGGGVVIGENMENAAYNFDIRSQVIFNGSFCGSKSVTVAPDELVGHLHLVYSGRLIVESSEGHRMLVDGPALVVLPRSIGHVVKSVADNETKIFCTAFSYQNMERQFIESFPRIIVFKAESEELQGFASLLFNEIESDGFGQKAVIDKICDILLIKIIRSLIDSGHLFQGMLAGLSHPKLSKTIAQLQHSPESSWSLDEMAAHAGMSRSMFAQEFLSTVGQTPNDFLTHLRIVLAKQLLKEDKAVSLVANSVGYEHGSALARVFRKKTGLSPKQWLNQLHGVG